MINWIKQFRYKNYLASEVAKKVYEEAKEMEKIKNYCFRKRKEIGICRSDFNYDLAKELGIDCSSGALTVITYLDRYFKSIEILNEK